MVQEDEDLKKLKKMAKNSENISDEEAEQQIGDVELPAEIQELIDSGQLPEDVIEGIRSGEISPEDLITYLQQLQEIPDETQEEIQKEVKKIGIFEALETDFQAILFYSINFLSDMSLQMAEEAMKQDEGHQTIHFTKRAEMIRQFCKKLFGFLAEHDYYLGGYKEIAKFRGKIPHEQMMQISQFAAQNVHMDEALQANPKLLMRTFAESVNSIKGPGLPTKYRSILKEEFRNHMGEDRPDKASVIFELFLLYKIVEEVYTSLKEENKKEE